MQDALVEVAKIIAANAEKIVGVIATKIKKLLVFKTSNFFMLINN